jgi:hypothetical protein
MSWPPQFIVKWHEDDWEGRAVGEPGVTMVARTVPVSVEDASRVVSASPVPTAVITVVPATDVATTEPPEVTVELMTVTAVRVAVVFTGTLVTV